MTNLSDIKAEVAAELRENFAKYQPELRDYVIDINGCYPWPVVIAFYGTPAEPMAWDYPGKDAEVEIIAIKTKDGVDILDVLPKEFVEALADDIKGGGCGLR